MSGTKSFTTYMWGRGKILVVLLLASIFERQARVFTPPMFIAQEPQMPSLQLLLNVRLGSISFLILMRASSTMGPQLLRSTLYSSILGLSPGFSGSHLFGPQLPVLLP